MAASIAAASPVARSRSIASRTRSERERPDAAARWSSAAIRASSSWIRVWRRAKAISCHMLDEVRSGQYSQPPRPAILDAVPKTLIVAEKPSVARDIANALPGPFQSPSDAYMESDDYVITFAVGHLVQLKDPEAYDERFKKWRMDDLPILPEKFELEPRDAKSKKQLKEIHKLMQREDVDRIVNACDAGREGELIFSYIYELAGIDKPVDRLWISSMTKQAIQGGFQKLRPGTDMGSLEQAARSRSEADWRA